jgi:hypothetical protein
VKGHSSLRTVERPTGSTSELIRPGTLISWKDSPYFVEGQPLFRGRTALITWRVRVMTADTPIIPITELSPGTLISWKNSLISWKDSPYFVEGQPYFVEGQPSFFGGKIGT